MSNPLQALQKSISLIGGQAELARQVGVRPQTVHVWLKKFGQVPTKHVLKIEKILNGVVSRSDLRPDIYPRSDDE